MSRRSLLTGVAVYAGALALVLGFVALRVKARYSYAAAVAPDEGCTRAHPTKVENNTVWLCIRTAAAVPAE